MDVVTFEDCMNEEYETQFWGFGSSYVIHEVKEIIAESFESNVTLLKETLKKNLGSKNNTGSTNDTKLNLAAEKLIAEYIDSLTKHSHGLETLLKDYFGIPPHVLLPENEIEKQQLATENEQQVIERDIPSLKRQYKRACILSDRHVEELKALDSIVAMDKQLSEYQKILTTDENLVFVRKCDGIVNCCKDLIKKNNSLILNKKKHKHKKYQILAKRFKHLNTCDNPYTV